MVKLTSDAFTLQSTSSRYKFTLLALSPLVLAHVLYRSFKDGGSKYFKQRLGFGYKQFNEKPIHFHCASVGEFLTAKPLILSLLELYPDKNILITCNTPTAANLINQLKQKNIQHYYFPLDFSYSVERFIKHTQPLCSFILETEIWPTYYHAAAKHKIKITILNARLSDKSLNTFNFVKAEYARTLNNNVQIFAQTEKDYENYLALGANKSATQLLGNLKYAIAKNNHKQLACTTIKRPFFLAASTHDNEELQISQHIELLKRKNYLLVLAPRYPDRCKQLAIQLRNMGLEVAIRSQHDFINQSTDVYIIDTLGELNMYFNEAALVFIGGSLIPRGGHNVLEPASFGKCVLVGPHTENFSAVVEDLLDANAITQVKNNYELGEQLIHLLKYDQKREEFGCNAADFMKQQAGVLPNYLSHITSIIEASAT